MTQTSPSSPRPISPRQTTQADPAPKPSQDPKPFDPDREAVLKALSALTLDVWGRASATSLSNCAIRGEWQADGVQALGKKVHEWAWSNRDRLDRTVEFVLRRTPFRGSPKEIAGQVIQLLACGWATR